MFAPEIGRLAGINVPIVPMAHEYLFTERIDGRRPRASRRCATRTTSSTSARRSAACAWAATSVDPAPWSLDGIPADFNGKLLAPDWPRFAEIMDGAVRRVPAIADAGINRMINGPEAFTPDNEFILGESEVRGFFVAAGFCAHGIAGAGGIGRQVASWIVDGEPELDLWKMDIRRFGAPVPPQALHARPDGRGLRDLLRHPLPERGAPGRPAVAACRRRTTRLVELGAPFGEKSGWERPNWFEIERRRPGDEALRPRGWAGQHWSPGDRRGGARDAHAPPASSTSRASPRSRSPGPGAAAFLQRLCANDIDRPVGSIIYTQLLNRRGGIECRPHGHPRSRPSGSCS